jgi:hypothetical protein
MPPRLQAQTKTNLCRKHFVDIALDKDAVDRVIRYTEGLAILEQQLFAAGGFIARKTASMNRPQANFLLTMDD